MLCKILVFATVLLAVSAQKKTHSRSECALTQSHRQDCGYQGIAANECIVRGCCWLPCEGCDKRIPWCFYSAGMLAPRCQVRPEDKQDCGFHGMKQSECVMKGCCWVPSNIPKDPWCFHEAGPGASTLPPSTPGPTEEGAEGAVRLVDGDSDKSGRVEIYHAGTWGTVCDDNFGGSAAEVVCRQLGYGTSDVVAYESAFFGPGTGPIHMDGFSCSGNEESLSACFEGTGTTFGESDCSHSEDASVRCGVESGGTGGSRGDLRLVNGGSDYGRLEIYDGSDWGSICDDGFYDAEATVACTQLGFAYGTSEHDAAFGESSLNIFLDGVSCTGDEERLEVCTHNTWGVHDCSHSEDVGVRCYATHPSTSVSPPQMLLVNDGQDGVANVGYLGVMYNGEPGSVCDDGFGASEAEVACRQLGFDGPSQVLSPGEVTLQAPPSTAPIHMDDVSCAGSEAFLWDCSFGGWGVHNCDHSEDIILRCGEEEEAGSGSGPGSVVEVEGAIRLVDGPESSAGRVEVYHNDQWGTICDDGFEVEEAMVICRALGLSGGIARKSAYFGQGEGSVWMDQLMCLGDEEALSACPFDGWGVTNCGHQEDAGVECSP